MAVKETYTTGALSVGGNLSTGGELKVSGNTTIGHNLKVEGWLDAKNVKGANKGIFSAPELLRQEYPNPENGWFAGVGSSIPCDLYTAWGGKWSKVDGGQMTVYTDSTIDANTLQQLRQEVNTLTNMVVDYGETALRIREVGTSGSSDGTDTIVLEPSTVGNTIPGNLTL